MTLKKAVIKVIEQNKSVKYVPTRFMQITKNGDIENLSSLISRLVLNEELTEEMEKEIEKHGDVLTIEDLIAEEKDHFGLGDDVVKQAKAKSEWFSALRLK